MSSLLRTHIYQKVSFKAWSKSEYYASLVARNSARLVFEFQFVQSLSFFLSFIRFSSSIELCVTEQIDGGMFFKSHNNDTDFVCDLMNSISATFPIDCII